jgi:hypothetical protein
MPLGVPHSWSEAPQLKGHNQPAAIHMCNEPYQWAPASLIERSARDPLGGEATVDFLPRGVVYTVICKLEPVG